MTAPKVSVLIINWNSGEHLARCFQTLTLARRAIPLQVILADNRSQEITWPWQEFDWEQDTAFCNLANLGFSAAVNRCLALARAEYVLLINPDCELLPGCLEELLQSAQAQPNTVVGPQLLGADGRLQLSGRTLSGWITICLELLLPGWIKNSALWRRHIYGRVDFAAPAWVEEVSGACLLAPRQAFTQTCGLDENYFMYYEETAWFARLKKMGYRVLYQPRARARHAHGASAQASHGEALRYFYASQGRYVLTHWGRRAFWGLKTAWFLLALRLGLGLLWNTERRSERRGHVQKLWQALRLPEGSFAAASQPQPK
jgi:hypothetical protein